MAGEKWKARSRATKGVTERIKEVSPENWKGCLSRKGDREQPFLLFYLTQPGVQGLEMRQNPVVSEVIVLNEICCVDSIHLWLGFVAAATSLFEPESESASGGGRGEIDLFPL